MLGRTHALSGAVVGAAVGLTATHLDPGRLALGVVLTAGAAVLPDIDHPDATCARSFGFVTAAFAWLIEHVSGGHRHGTHSLVGIAAFSAAAYTADAYRQLTAGKIALAVPVAAGAARLHHRDPPGALVRCSSSVCRAGRAGSHRGRERVPGGRHPADPGLAAGRVIGPRRDVAGPLGPGERLAGVGAHGRGRGGR